MSFAIKRFINTFYNYCMKFYTSITCRRIFALILLIEIFASTVNGQLLFYGACPWVKTKQDLDLTKLNLIVYENSKYFMDTRIYDECNGLHFIADLETVSVTAFKAEFA